MKKLLSISIMMLMVLTVSAQGEWEVTEVKGDELKGTQDATAYTYSVEGMGSLILWDFNNPMFRLVSTTAQFNTVTHYNQYSGSYSGVKILIGIYNDNDKLLESMDLWLDRSDNMGNYVVQTRPTKGMNGIIGQKKKVQKMFKALKSNGGYVRIVVPRFQTTDFDIKIKPYIE